MSALLDTESSAAVPAVLPGIARVSHPEYTPKVLPFRSRTAIPQVGEVAHPEYSQKVSPGLMRLPAASPESVSLRVLMPDFNFGFDATVVQLRRDNGAGQLSMRAAVDTNVEANITFAGRVTDDGTSLEIEDVSFRLATTQDCARADFVASTLNAALGLSHRVHFQIPEISLDLALGFDLPLIEIGRLLQSRQTSHRLMTIERATGIRFDLPLGGFSGTDIAAIIFVFRAIVDRSFPYHLINGIPIVIEADEVGAQRLKSLEESPVMAFGPEEVTKRLLGLEISLGRMTLKIRDPYIVDIERVREEVVEGDAHPVTVLFRSATNQALFELPDGPRLLPNPWDARIQALIALEEALDSTLVERYHALAASTLAGLSEEEKNRVTRRVELDEETFLD